MENNGLTKKRVLGFLRDVYKQEFNRFSPVSQIADNIGLPHHTVQEFLKQYEKDGFLISFLNIENLPQYKINVRGLEELDRLEKEYFRELSNNDETAIDLDIQYEDFKGIMTVFVSHKFVKTDQNLALILQDKLKEYKISGHLAERKKPYDSLVRDKIMKSIQNSDYLIAIITKEASGSASLNQEIGYALGLKVPVIIMRERNVDHGVLTYGLQDEEFTRENFERSCENVIQYIIKIGKREKISDKNKRDLIDNVYRPCYNQMMNVYNNREFLTYPPENPWDKIEHFWKLNTESDIKLLFEQYSNEVKKWAEMFILDFGNKFMEKRDKLGEILKPIFEKHGLLDPRGHIMAGKWSNPPREWLHNSQYVIFNENIRDRDELYQILKNDAKGRYGEEYSQHLVEWYHNNPNIFTDILKSIPELVKNLGTKYSYAELETQRRTLIDIIEKLTKALEEKLR